MQFYLGRYWRVHAPEIKPLSIFEVHSLWCFRAKGSCVSPSSTSIPRGRPGLVLPHPSGMIEPNGSIIFDTCLAGFSLWPRMIGSIGLSCMATHRATCHAWNPPPVCLQRSGCTLSPPTRRPGAAPHGPGGGAGPVLPELFPRHRCAPSQPHVHMLSLKCTDYTCAMVDGSTNNMVVETAWLFERTHRRHYYIHIQVLTDRCLNDSSAGFRTTQDRVELCESLFVFHLSRKVSNICASEDQVLFCRNQLTRVPSRMGY